MKNAISIALLKTVIVLFIVLSGIHCENSIEVINKLSNVKETPLMLSTNWEMLYSDSAKVKVKVMAKTIKVFNTSEKQYKEFPNGINVLQYDTLLKVVSTIRSDYAIGQDKSKIWELRGNVIARNLQKEEQLFSEELFWDQNKAIIYSNKFTKIITTDRVFYGSGFTSNEDLSNWRLTNLSGSFTIKENENAQTNP